jgi:PIN domain nuclease of toxin-antitoxin system
MDVATVDNLIGTLQLNVISFDRTQARLAGSLRATTRKFGLSLGDRACLVLAQSRAATALTCDSVWTRFEAPCKVELAR